MSSLLLLLPTSRYGFGGSTPQGFDLGPGSTLHYASSANGVPGFGTYKDAYLRTKTPSTLDLPSAPKKYLDNPPK